MRKLILLFLASTAFATTAVTGHIGTLGTTSVTSNSFARFWLRGCGGNQPRVGASAVIAPSQGGVFFFDIPANSSGDLSGTLYSNRDLTGLTGGEIECGGSHTATWYGMQIFYAGKGGPETPILAKDTDSFDISNITPITTAPVETAPNGDNTYARLDAGNQPFTGDVTPSGTGVLALGTLTNRWKGFFSTLDASGAATFSGTANFSAQMTGATAGIFTNSPVGENGIFGFTLNSCSPGGEYTGIGQPGAVTDGLTGCVTIPNTATAHQADGLAGYVDNLSTSTNAVGGYFSATAGAANTHIWGSNSISSDMGKSGVTQVGHEIDVNISGTAPGTPAWGVEINGNQTSASNTTDTADLGRVGALLLTATSNGGWNTGFACNNGALHVSSAFANGGVCFLSIPQATGNSQDSHGSAWVATTSGGAHVYEAAYEDRIGVFHLYGTGPVQIDHRAAFSTLPACASAIEGAMSPVTDSSTNTWGATITGLGANHVLAYCDGSNWTVAAK